MTKSSSLSVAPRRRAFARLIGEIRHSLNQALTEEQKTRGLTRTEIAHILGVNKSIVSRKLNGTSNMTLETLADLAYALNRPVKVDLPSRALPPGSNQYVAPPPVAAASTVRADTPVLTPATPTTRSELLVMAA
jgi:transcriptional regulator with XRE-family HTH domain